MIELRLDTLPLVLRENPTFKLVGLRAGEVKIIREKALERNSNAAKKGYFNKAGTTDHDVAGLAGEFAVSLFYGVPITAIFTEDPREFQDGDVGKIEVKSRRENRRDRWDLASNTDRIYEDRPYVVTLVCLFPTCVVIAGWEMGSVLKREGKIFKNKAVGHDFSVLSLDKLRDPESLFDWLKSNNERRAV